MLLFRQPRPAPTPNAVLRRFKERGSAPRVGWQVDSDGVGESYWDGRSWGAFRIRSERGRAIRVRGAVSALAALGGSGLVLFVAVVTLLGLKGSAFPQELLVICVHACAILTGLLGAASVASEMHKLRRSRADLPGNIKTIAGGVLLIVAAVFELVIVAVVALLVGVGLGWWAIVEARGAVSVEPRSVVTLSKTGVTVETADKGRVEERYYGYEHIAEVSAITDASGTRLQIRVSGRFVATIPGRFRREAVTVAAARIHRQVETMRSQ